MPWLNIPVAIIENDLKTVERIYSISGSIGIGGVGTITSYSRSVAYVSTRYVGSDYNGAKTFRDALLTQYPPSAVWNAPTIEASVQSAGGGQYHVLATLKTITAWVLGTTP